MDLSSTYEDFCRDGFAVIKDFLSSSDVDCLFGECADIVQNMVIPKHCSVFSDQARDEYFLNSGDNISYFYEKDAVDENGELVTTKEMSLNKVGHALHWLNSSFKSVTFSANVKNVLKHFKYEDPAIVQSMIIFKHPEIGGEVTPHQDSTFLYTEPLSTIGFWIPLVDITLENGCLWFFPGSHKNAVYQKFVRNTNPPHNPLLLMQGEIPSVEDKHYVPVLVKKGDCVLIHGSVLHKSGRNLSKMSRTVYTFHAVEKKETEYSKENWLQPTEVLPFPSVYSN